MIKKSDKITMQDDWGGGVTLKGANVTTATSQEIERLQKERLQRMESSFSAGRGSAGRGNSGEPPYGGGGSNSGKPNENHYIPGRLSSKFDDKSMGKFPIVTTGSKEMAKNQYAIGIEHIVGSDGRRVTLTFGSEGYTHNYKRMVGDNRSLTSGVTGHKSGHFHMHPDQSDPSQNYWKRAGRWLDRKTILSNIIDKGRKPK